MSLQINNLKKTYWQGSTKIEALKDINLSIESGELVAILGASGSGKSTLLGLLAGLDYPESGSVELNGVNLYALNDKDRTAFRAKNISLVFQQYHLVPHLSAVENVKLPLEILGNPDTSSLAENILSAVGLKERLHHLPSQLSGGECQRVAIARALITNPKLLLADEPSGNLDSDTAQAVMDLFFTTVRQEKITSVLVTHNEDLAKRCDRILRLKGGTI